MTDWIEVTRELGFPMAVSMILLYDKIVYQPKLIKALERLTTLIEQKK